MQKYKHLYFDLDHTLWDFETNSAHTLEELFSKYHLNEYFDNFTQFIERCILFLTTDYIRLPH